MVCCGCEAQSESSESSEMDSQRSGFEDGWGRRMGRNAVSHLQMERLLKLGVGREWEYNRWLVERKKLTVVFIGLFRRNGRWFVAGEVGLPHACIPC